MTHEKALKIFRETIEAGATVKEAINIVYLKCIEAGESLQDADAIAAIARKDYEALSLWVLFSFSKINIIKTVINKNDHS